MKKTSQCTYCLPLLKFNYLLCKADYLKFMANLEAAMTLAVRSSEIPLLPRSNNPPNCAAVFIRENPKLFITANAVIAIYGAVVDVVGSVSKDLSLKIYAKPIGWGLIILGSIFGETVRRAVVHEADTCWKMVDCYWKALGCSIIPILLFLSLTEIPWSDLAHSKK